MIKYLGSKRRLLPVIEGVFADLDAERPIRTVVDLFSGTARVGRALKGRGFTVAANDHTAYAHTLARCYVEADADDVEADARRIIDELNALPGDDGWFTEMYCRQSRFFQEGNGARIEAIRRRIDEMALPPVLEAVVLTSLLEAADRVDSTCGVQMAYLKQWSKRSFNTLEMRLPELTPKGAFGPSSAHQLDATTAATTLAADVVYLDPPYNRHSYLSNYHVWETLTRFDEPDVYGIARKRTECQTKKSAFNRPRSFIEAFTAVIDALQTRTIVVSYSNEGAVAEDDLVAVLARRGTVRLAAEEGYPRYVGATIGQHNPLGKRVGEATHTDNVEYLFIVDVDA